MALLPKENCKLRIACKQRLATDSNAALGAMMAWFLGLAELSAQSSRPQLLARISMHLCNAYLGSFPKGGCTRLKDAQNIKSKINS